MMARNGDAKHRNAKNATLIGANARTFSESWTLQVRSKQVFKRHPAVDYRSERETRLCGASRSSWVALLLRADEVIQ
jgi:hypothetical protein